jgi:spore coat protein U-like protein
MMRPALHAVFPAALLAACAAAPAKAATCSVIPVGIAFGAYDPFSPTDLETAGTIRLECDAVVSATISLGTGAGDHTQRRMGNGQSALGYNLFTSSQRIVVWGDGTGGSSTVSVSTQAADLAVYGTVPARQNVTTGTYADTIVVTVTF